MAKGTYVLNYRTEHVVTHCQPLACAMLSPASTAAADMFYSPTILHSIHTRRHRMDGRADKRGGTESATARRLASRAGA
eukprot:5928907-Pleurochrysis_carterae.AAC.1